MTFHDLSKFSITYVTPSFSKYCQNNLLFKVFSQIDALNPVLWLAVIISTFDLFAFFAAFLWLSKIHPLNFTTFQKWKMKSQNSMTFQVSHNKITCNPWTIINLLNQSFFPVTTFYWKLCFIWQIRTALNYLPTMKYFYLVYQISHGVTKSKVWVQ